MNFVELKAALKEPVKAAYLVFGADIYLVQKAVQMITEAAGVLDAQLDVSVLDEFANVEAIVAECRTVSFLGGRRVVIVRSAVAEQLNRTLNAYLNSPNSDCVLIITVNEDKAPAVLKNIETVDCNPMSTEIIVKLIGNQLAKSNKKITVDAAKMLCDFCGATYARIDNEINKLVNYYDKDVLTADDIAAVVTKTEEYQVYELSNAICRGDQARAQEILDVLQRSGVDDYAIFGNLVSNFRRLFYALTCKGTNEIIAAFCKCSPYAIMYARRDNKHLGAKISDIYAKSLDLEYQIKSGKVSVESAISLLQFAVAC